MPVGRRPERAPIKLNLRKAPRADLAERPVGPIPEQDPAQAGFCGAASATALLAAHRAFIAAESCARRSGERLSFRFTFLAAPRAFSSAGFGLEVFVWFGGDALTARRGLAARTAASLLALAAFAATAASSFRFSLASFLGPSCRRVSSRRIFFLRVFSFISDKERAPGHHSQGRIGFRVKD